MKRLCASISIFVLAVLCAPAAWAQGYHENDSGLYWGVRGGLAQLRQSTWLVFPRVERGVVGDQNDDIAPAEEWRNLEMDYGFVVGASVGIKKAFPGYAGDLRFEVEAIYRRNENGQTNAEFKTTGPGLGFGHVVGAVDGTIEVTSIMFNTLLEFHTPTRFAPYVGLGAGISQIHFDVDLYDPARAIGWFYPYPWTIDQTYNALSWQGIIGVGYNLSPGTQLTVEVRHFRLAGDRYSYLMEWQELEDIKFDDWSVGLRYTF